MDTALDVRRVLGLLPHRFPCVLVDRVLELVPGRRIVGLKNVTVNEPFFSGHFPENPIMPGVLILEALAQCGGILVYHGMDAEERGTPIYLAGCDKVRFRRPVVPGDQIILTMEMNKRRSMLIKMTGTAAVDGQLAAEAELLAAIGEAET
jgi:3-hydroxyacyl-[acyl-carrier-protein] dehydratase